MSKRFLSLLRNKSLSFKYDFPGENGKILSENKNQSNYYIMDSNKEINNEKEISKIEKVEEEVKKDTSDLKKLITKVDNRVKTKVFLSKIGCDRN